MEPSHGLRLPFRLTLLIMHPIPSTRRRRLPGLGRLFLVLTALFALLSVHAASSAGSPVRVNPVPRPRQEGEVLRALLVQAASLIRVQEARTAYGVDGSGLTAAVLDSGIRTTHRDFAGRIVAQVNYTTENGNNPANATDGDGHGTHVSGIIAANSVHTGMAPGASIAALKVLDNNGDGDFDGIIEALEWVIANRTLYNITVVNLSLGDGQNYTNFGADTMRARVSTLRNAGVAVCAAAGNDYFRWGSAQGMGYPAIFPETTSVSAVYDANVGPVAYFGGAAASSTGPDRICPFSQRLHSTVSSTMRTDVFAPGGSILSAGITSDTSSASLDGTSQATPMVAGVILLMQDYYQRATGGLPTVDQIEGWLRAGAVNIVDGDDELDNVVNTQLTYQRIDALAALQAEELDLGASYSISGQVTLDSTGLPGVTVSTGTRSATTAADGRYTITGLASGSYTVTPSRAGYTFSPQNRTVVLAPSRTGVDFTATAVATTYSISGTVRGSNGLGLGNVTVQSGALSAVSDTNGAYTLAGLPAGTYTVTSARSGYTFSPGSQSVTVGPNRTGIDFVGTADQNPPTTYTIRGTVTEGSVGLLGVTITAGGKTTTTLANGTYLLSGFNAGTYTVTAARTGYVMTPGSRSVALGPSATAVDFVAAQPTYTVRGTVSLNGAGLAGVLVSAGNRNATTDGQGQYAISNLAAGQHVLTASATGYSFTPESLTLSVSSDVTNANFTAVDAKFRIAGRITVSGAGVGGVSVLVGAATVLTDAAGNYSATGLDPGTYSVRPSSPNHTFTPSARSFTVGPDRTDANFTGVRLAEIRGRVTLNGAGLPNVTITTGARSVVTDSSGGYGLPGLTAGNYTLVPSGDGQVFAPVSRSVTVGGTDVTGADFAVQDVPHLIMLTPGTTSVTGGKSVSLTITFDRPVTATTDITLQSSSADAKGPAIVRLKRGKSSIQFAVKTRKVTAPVTATITATSAGLSRQAILTINPKAPRR